MTELLMEDKGDGICSVNGCYKKSVICIKSPLLSQTWPICKKHKKEFFNPTQCSISGVVLKQENEK